MNKDQGSSGNVSEALIGDAGQVGAGVFTGAANKNRADALTRLRKMWLNGLEKQEKDAVVVASLQTLDIRELHNLNYMGVERTLHLLRKIDLHILLEQVK